MAEPTALESLWPPLAKFLDVIFCPQGLDRARMSVFSHEELYRSVYTICLRGNRHDLLDRLLSFAEIAFAQTERDINAAFEENGVNSGGLGEGGIGEVAGKWLTRFGRALTDATKATESAIHVFAYLDRTHVRLSHPPGLRDLILTQFQRIVLASPATEEKLFVALHMWERSNGQGPLVAPGFGDSGLARIVGVDERMVKSIVWGVYDVSKQNYRFNPPLFSRLLPLREPPVHLPPPDELVTLTSQFDQALTQYNLAEIRRDMAAAAGAGGFDGVGSLGGFWNGAPKRTAAERSHGSPNVQRRGGAAVPNLVTSVGGSATVGLLSGRDEGKVVKRRNVAAVGGVDLVAPPPPEDPPSSTDESGRHGSVDVVRRSNVTRGENSGVAVRGGEGVIEDESGVDMEE